MGLTYLWLESKTRDYGKELGHEIAKKCGSPQLRWEDYRKRDTRKAECIGIFNSSLSRPAIGFR